MERIKYMLSMLVILNFSISRANLLEFEQKIDRYEEVLKPEIKELYSSMLYAIMDGRVTRVSNILFSIENKEDLEKLSILSKFKLYINYAMVIFTSTVVAASSYKAYSGYVKHGFFGETLPYGIFALVGGVFTAGGLYASKYYKYLAEIIDIYKDMPRDHYISRKRDLAKVALRSIIL